MMSSVSSSCLLGVDGSCVLVKVCRELSARTEEFLPIVKIIRVRQHLGQALVIGALHVLPSLREQHKASQ